MSTSSEQSAAENNPMDVVAMEPEEAQDHIEDIMNDLAARIVTVMGEIPTTQEHAAEVPHLQELSARVSQSERWQKQAPEVKFQHTVASILFAVFQRVEDITTFSSPSNVHHINWHCLNKMMQHGLLLGCSDTVTLQDLVPNAPFGALTFSSPFESLRLSAILPQSHDPKSYNDIKPTELGLAWSFLQQHCTHMALTTAARAELVATEHLSRKSREFINLENVADKARQLVKNNPWTNLSCQLLAPRKNLIVLPAGFGNEVKCLGAETQKMQMMREPEDMQPEWFIEDYSAIVIFNTEESVGALRWCTAWTLLRQTVVRGSELNGLADPQNGEDWGRSVDSMCDLFEETIAQRPTMGTRIRCFLPLQLQQEMQGVGFGALTDKISEQLEVLTQSAAERFWSTTMVQHSAFLHPNPSRRVLEMRMFSDGQAEGPTQRNENGRTSHSGPSRRPRKPNRKRQHHHSHRLTAPREHLLERPLQLIANRIFKYVPVNAGRRSKAHGCDGRPQHKGERSLQLH